MSRRIIEIEDDELVIKKDKPRYGWDVTLFGIIMAIVTFFLMLLGIGWYFKQDRATKRKFWVVVIIFAILSWLWQGTILELFAEIPTRHEYSDPNI